MEQILILEDDIALNQGLCKALKTENRKIVSCETIKAARDQLLCGCPSLILLDINLPDGSGLDFLQELKRNYPTIPVILLTANDTDMDIVKGLELGADDYITKPFSLSVLRARVNTQLRKAESLQAHTSASIYKKGCYEFDFERMIFLVDGQEIELSKTEQRLLRLLVQNEGINLRRDFLLDRVWNDSAEFVDANALSVSVKRLRDKLGTPDSIKIKTVYGIGYRFE